MNYRTQLAISISVDWKKRLAEIAEQRTSLQDRHVCISDLVREALDEVFMLARATDERTKEDNNE